MTGIGDRVEHAIAQRADVEHEIVEAEAAGPQRGGLRRTVFWLIVTGVSLYLVAPSLVDVFGSWQDLEELAPGWLVATASLQALALACLWARQHVALRRPSWPVIVSSQLAGNALAKIAPGGGALGAALQYRMLVRAGVPSDRAVAGLTATSLLTFAVVLALPVLALPAILHGGVSRNLLDATAVGIVVLVALFAIGVLLIVFDRPLAWVGRVIQRAQPHPAPCGAAAAAAAAAPARPDTAHRDPRPALEARAGSHQRPLGVRLCDAVGRAGCRGLPAAAGTRAARVLRRADPRPDPDHARGRWLPLPVGLAAFGWHARRYRAVEQVAS